MVKDYCPLVTFVVPCYNVELYIENCINSILLQSYKNIEVIPVDDGSPDKSGEIIDRMAIKDKRVKPVHKENGGVSSARNVGIEAASGDYIVFVDGDDYLALDYTEYMIGMAINNDAEFVLSQNCYSKEGENQIVEDSIKCLSSEDATVLLLSPRIVVGCWNKMFKRSLLLDNDIHFSTTQFYGEGLLFITTVSQLANKTVIGNKKVYYYRRNNYLSACTKFNINNYYNGSSSIDIIEKNLKVRTPKVLKMLEYHRCQFKMGTVVRLLESGKEKEYSEYYRECLSHVRKKTWGCLSVKGVSLYKKSLLVGTCISPWLMAKLDSRRRRFIQSKSF